MAEGTAGKRRASPHTLEEANRFATIADASEGRPIASWKILQVQVAAGDFADACHHAAAIAARDPFLGAGAWAMVGSALSRAQKLESAHEALQNAVDLLQKIRIPSDRSCQSAMIALEYIRMGRSDRALPMVPYIEEERGRHLCEVAEALIQAGDHETLKSILLACADSRDSVVKLCGVLAKAFPEQAVLIAEALLGALKQSCHELQ
jgi:hypothetical protein